MKVIFASIVALFASTALALPGGKDRKTRDSVSGCDSVDMSAFTPPEGLTPVTTPYKFVGMGFGTQNYTCDDTSSTYKSIGAFAKLLDFSCAASPSDQLFETEKSIFNDWKNSRDPIEAFIRKAKISGRPQVLGEHYFVNNPAGSGISPKWDFTNSRNDPNAFVIGARTGGVPSPDGPANIDWLSLSNVQGGLANGIYRAFTIAGQPPSSCKPGTDPELDVKYAAIYYFV